MIQHSEPIYLEAIPFCSEVEEVNSVGRDVVGGPVTICNPDPTQIGDAFNGESEFHSVGLLDDGTVAVEIMTRYYAVIDGLPIFATWVYPVEWCEFPSWGCSEINPGIVIGAGHAWSDLSGAGEGLGR